MPGGVVIVGTGQAGFEAAASLRAEGYHEPITLVGEEPHIPYQRPPLSKGFLLDKQPAGEIELRPETFYGDHKIDLLCGEKVVAIERRTRRVQLASGSGLTYRSLVLAVGARNRPLPVEGAALDGVLYLRTIDDALWIKARLQEAQDVVVVGGGFIGLELAASARSLGKNVTVLEALPRLMSRVVAPVISTFYDELHKQQGARVVCGATVERLVGTGDKVREVRLADGRSFAADVVLVGIGVVPNLELARDADLAVGNGIAVDEWLRTTDADIYAIGDCTEHPNPFAGGRVRLESVQNAVDQARWAAKAIVGREARYDALPWFWTDQYDVRLQMAGLSHGYNRVVLRGNKETRKFSLFYFKDRRLLAVDSINRPADHIVARRLLAAHAPITPEQAGDESIDLKKIGKPGA